MEFIKKNLANAYKLLKGHLFLHFISYAFCALSYVHLFSYKKKYFIITFLTFQTLLVILISQIICLLKTTNITSFDQIKCSLNIYTFISLIYFILIVTKFVLIFQMFNFKNKYKIILICVSIIYYIFDSLIFIYEYYIIFQQIKKNISDRIIIQLAQNRNIVNNSFKNETQPSEKNNNNVTFEKEDTVYIICGKMDDNNNNNNQNNSNKNNKVNFFSEIDNKSNNKEIIILKNKKSNNKINSNNNDLNNTNISSKRKIPLSEENKSKSFEQIKSYSLSSKEI